MTLRTAIIGTGYGAKVHAPILQAHPDFEVVAIASMRSGKARDAATSLGIPNAFDDWRQMLRENHLDALVIASTPSHHMEMTLAALDANLHVICEKPPALNLDQAKAMMTRAVSSQRVAAMNFEWRYLAERQAIKKVIEQDNLGDILHVNWSDSWPMWPAIRDRAASWLWQTKIGGGLLGAIGSHMIDSLHYWFGPISQVMGVTENHVPFRPGTDGSELTDADDSFSFIAKLATGGLCTLQFTTCAVSTEARLEIYGTRGTLKLVKNELQFAAVEDKVFRTVEQAPSMDNAAFPEAIRGYVHPQFTFYTEFAKAVQGKKSSSLPTLVDAAYVQAVIDTIHRSNGSGLYPIPHF